jgi:hypothetical protein
MTQINLPGQVLVIAYDDGDKALQVNNDSLLLLSDYIEIDNKPSPHISFRESIQYPLKVALIHPLFLGYWMNTLIDTAIKIDIPKFVYHGQRNTYSLGDITEYMANC